MIAFAYAVKCQGGREAVRSLATAGGCGAVQLVGCGLVPSLRYSLAAALQAYESAARGLGLARRPEIDLLLRLLRTDRIEVALAAASGWRGDCCVLVGYGDEACARAAAEVANAEGIQPAAQGDELAIEEAALLNSGAKPPGRQRVLDA